MQRGLLVLGGAAVAFVSACVSAPDTQGAHVAVSYQPGITTAPAQPLQWNFDHDQDGGLLPSTVVFGGIWGVQPEAGTPSRPQALCQTGRGQLPAISLSDAVFGDVVLTARFKPISGREDQTAGLLFRIQDQVSFYIMTADALANNVNVYKYGIGQRISLKGGHARVLSGQWQEARVEAIGNRFRGFLNGQQVVEATDDTYRAGQTGLGTRADSLTCFDDVEARTP